MERDNFYILLELSLDPPETDPERIESAIAKKQAEWSRLRNHPTKGLQAQQSISMIPEIRRVMNDPDLREKEARAAKSASEQDKAGKLHEIDSHLDILMGKGFVSKEEVTRLARHHEISEKDIQDRIRRKKEQKFARVDQQLSLRMAKGYITEAEIGKLARRHNLKPDEVKSRVSMPLLKSGKEKDHPPPRQMDRSLEKSIRENLKIVGKSSLYDFLGLHESADIESLQTAAAEKKKQLSHAGKKDAAATAGSTLAGHCSTIFKNEETRISYDIGLAKARLAELDSDIDISAFNGKIRHEYYQILVRKAMDFGMEESEAHRYIKDYCKQKNWGIEQPETKTRKFRTIGLIFSLVLIAVVSAGFFYVNYNREEQRQEEFAEMTARIAQNENKEAGIRLLRQYIQKNQAQKGYGALVEDARVLKDELRLEIAENRFAEKMAHARSLLENNEFAAARTVVNDYLQTAPPEAFAEKARDQIEKINKKAEQKDFEDLSRMTVEAEAGERIRALTGYMEKHPDGNHIGEVRQMIEGMRREYYLFVKNRIESARAEEDWQRCVSLAQSYISLYDDSNADILERELADYKENMRQEQIFAALKKKAGEYGDDYPKAARVYADYLEAYPETPIRDTIEGEIERLQQLNRKAELDAARDRLLTMIEDTGGRFVEEEKGVVKDTENGLMWTLLDSGSAGDRNCMTYEQARDYTESLNTGGHADWRLPTAGELDSIYREKPAFPVQREKRYWSSDSHSRYSEGWYRIVEIIEVCPDGETTRGHMDSRECGVVRAVRQ